jgi:hypothetical protein
MDLFHYFPARERHPCLHLRQSRPRGGEAGAEVAGAAAALPVRAAERAAGSGDVPHLPRQAAARAAVQRGARVPPHVPRGVHPCVGDEDEQLPALQGQDRAGCQRHGVGVGRLVRARAGWGQ